MNKKNMHAQKHGFFPTVLNFGGFLWYVDDISKYVRWVGHFLWHTTFRFYQNDKESIQTPNLFFWIFELVTKPWWKLGIFGPAQNSSYFPNYKAYHLSSKHIVVEISSFLHICHQTIATGVWFWNSPIPTAQYCGGDRVNLSITFNGIILFKDSHSSEVISHRKNGLFCCSNQFFLWEKSLWQYFENNLFASNICPKKMDRQQTKQRCVPFSW